MISAVVPVYNEGPRLAASLREIAGFLRERHPGDHELIVVDDGSTDHGLREARALEAELSLTILENGINLGKGAAVRRGMLASNGDPVFFTDADLSTPLDELLRFEAAHGEGADVVIGTRKHPEARIETPQGTVRTVMGLGYTRLVNGVLGLSFSDYTCGFKSFRREAARAIFSRSVVTGWSFDAEILFLARRLGFAVREIPVRWADRPHSKVRVGRDTAASLGEVLAIRLRDARGGYG